jgi:cytochrome c-type biogenesis protein
MDFGAGTAFLGGLLTFASPCVLPLIPIYLSVLVGGSVDEVKGADKRFKLLVNGLFFVLGFLAVFVLLGMTASALGRFLMTNRLLFQQLGGLLVFFFGLKFLGLVRLDILDREKRFQLGGGGTISPMGAALIGFTFAFGWTPCIGPILGSILTFTAVSTNSVADGAVMLLLYGLGIGLPLLIVAAFAQSGTRFLRTLNRFIPKLERATGAVLVVVAVLMVTDSLGVLTLDPGETSSARISKEMTVNVKREPARPVLDAKRPAAEALADSPDGAQQCGAEASSCGIEGGGELFAEADFEMSLGDLTVGPVVLDFFKPDCPACLKMVPVLQTLGTTCSGEGLRIEKIDISDPVNKQLAIQMGVLGTPTLLFFDNQGQEVSRLVGAQSMESVHRAVAVLMGEVCADFSRFDT